MSLIELASIYEPIVPRSSCVPTCTENYSWCCDNDKHSKQRIIFPDGVHERLAGTWPPGYRPQCYWGIVADGIVPIPFIDAETGERGEAPWLPVYDVGRTVEGAIRMHEGKQDCAVKWEMPR